ERRVTKNKNSKATKATLDALNSNSLSGVFSDKYNSFSTALGISKKMKNAEENNNLFDYQNLKHDAFFNFIISGVKVGRFSTRIKQLEMLKDLDNEAFAEVLGVDPETVDSNDRLQANSYVNKLVETAKNIKSIYEGLEQVTTNPFTHYTNTDGDPNKENSNLAWEQFNDFLSSTAYFISTAKDAN